MTGFSYKNLRLVTQDKKGVIIDKWYVGYQIDYHEQWPDYAKDLSASGRKYPKIYGAEYQLKINTFKNPEEKLKKAELLLEMVRRDLNSGLDPRLKGITVEKQERAKLERAQGVTYDEAYKIMVDYYGWDNPTDAQALTAHNNKIYYNSGFRKFVESIGKTGNVLAITSKDIEDFIIQKNASGDWGLITSMTKYGNFNFFFTPMVEAGKLEVSPLVGIKNLKKKLKKTTKQKPPTNRFALWTLKEIEDFIEVGTNNPRFLLDYTVGMTCFHAFIRKSEMLRLTLGMVDIENKKFMIPSNLTKSGHREDYEKIIHLHISNELVEILKDYIKARFGDDLNREYPLFCSRRDKTKEYDYFQYEKDYRKRLGKALNNGKANYSLKHTGVSMYWKEQSEKGVAIGTILSRLQKKCRHKNIIETMRYLSTDLGIDIDIEDDE